ncbi:MAG: hypothetical protein SNJ67_03320 [Chloracidobacterium sp.]|uniref:Uncharacterized protein n=1 Tax=Chloracidobacterium validum TaxID=2821543 RepID=A0ABX8B5P1_9BACT|nr:hypothetical protein [Chloracidobacterium validum]QUW02289.1 hypothetical protein J8C06_07940 [Chloracidobacterium validum]
MRGTVWLLVLAGWLSGVSPMPALLLAKGDTDAAATDRIAYAIQNKDEKKDKPSDDKKKEPRFIDKKPKEDERKDDKKKDKPQSNDWQQNFSAR